MAKNTAESRIPVSRVVRPSFLPKPKTPTGQIKHIATTTTTTTTTNRRSTVVSSGCMTLTDSFGDVNCRTPIRGRVPPLCASTPTDDDNVIKKQIITSNWNTNNSQYDCINKTKIDDKLIGTLGILDDIGDSCLIDSTIFNDINFINNNNNNTGQQQQNYLTLIKQNSFEHDESLGILTPDQMTDFTVALGGSRTPSYENLTGSKLAIVPTNTNTTTPTTTSSNLSRPTNVQFINDNDNNNNNNNDLLCERSPSLEELPLDPKPLLNNKLNINQQNQLINTIKPTTTSTTSTILPITNILNASTSLLPMSFVTSVTSITSLEAGYQGDGENSRPASRGPDTSSSVQTVSTNCKNCHIQDPMTDSDFFTESDADAHEDIIRGDRRAQIIDGTLFCPPTGRQYQNFVTEEMDSSGIYSDIDKKQDELINDNNLLDVDAIINNNNNDNDNNNNIIDNVINEINDIKDVKLPVTVDISSCTKDYLQAPIKSIETSKNSSIESILGTNNNNINNNSDNNNIIIDNKIINNNELPNKSEISSFKKYKMPKKYVASKIKAMIESNNNNDDLKKEQRRIVRSPRKPGRWTEVVKKIEAGKTEQRLRPQRKDIKSRIMQNITTTSSSSSSSTTTSSPLTTTIASVKKSSSSLRNTNNSNGNKDKRTIRSNNNNQIIQETAQSSMSDISNVTTKNTVQKRSPQSSNQQRRLTNGRNNTTLKSRGTINDAKKSCPIDFTPITLDKSPTPIRKSTPTKRSVNNNNNIQNSLSTCVSTSSVKDRMRRESHSSSPVLIKNDTIEQSAQTELSNNLRDVKSSENIIQALCLTIQYLNHQLEEYSLNAQEEINIIKKKLINDFELERKNDNIKTNELIDNIKNEHKKNIELYENKLYNEKNDYEIKLNITKKNLHDEYDNIIKNLKIKYDNDIKLKNEELNNNINNNELTIIKDEYNKLKYYIKPIWKIKNNINKKLNNDIIELKKQLQDKKLLQKKINELNIQINELKKSNNNLYNIDTYDINDNNDSSSTLHAEVWSLRSVLELQSQKNSSMRSEIDKLRRDIENKELLEQRIETLEARCEDLKAQLQCKESYERKISHQNEILLGSFHDVSKHNKRLTQRNEELQWRLRQKNEVVNVLANQLSVPPQRLSRSLGPENIDHSLIQDKNNNNQQSTSSSMIKFMVQKGDSVSWTLEIDDTSDPLPNNHHHDDDDDNNNDNNNDDNNNNRNITRHSSFRKTPRKKIDIRTRSKSVSTSDNINKDNNNWSPNYNSTPITTRNRQQNDNNNNNKTNNDQINDSSLIPQEAGGEAMISEETSATSSEDESSASSDISRLAMDFEWSNSVE